MESPQQTISRLKLELSASKAYGVYLEAALNRAEAERDEAQAHSRYLEGVLDESTRALHKMDADLESARERISAFSAGEL